MRIVVTGGRAYSDFATVASALKAVHTKHRIDCLIHGGARGADSLCHQWAKQNQIPIDVYWAEWGKYGKGAGPNRNQKMIDEGKPDAAIAFEGGTGTADMVKRCKAAKLPVWEVNQSSKHQ
jgi:hypothetical protein